MRVYESIYILKPDLIDEDVDKLVKRINKIIEDNSGKILHVEKWGKRRLAYEVAKEKYGYYVLLHFEAEPETVSELERNYRLIAEVNKYIIIRLNRKELAKFEAEMKTRVSSERRSKRRG
jgi:small subunit ribosomal protein S6